VSLTTFVSSEATANSGKVIEDEVQEFLQVSRSATVFAYIEVFKGEVVHRYK